MEKVFDLVVSNSCTPFHRTVKLLPVSSKKTVPPELGSRSSHRPATRGGPLRCASVDSENAALLAPNVMLPFAFTNSDVYRLPQKSIGKSGNNSAKPSSPTFSGAPGSGMLKMTLTPVRVAPAATTTGAKVPGASAFDSAAPLANSSTPGRTRGGVENPPSRISSTYIAYCAPGVNPVKR